MCTFILFGICLMYIYYPVLSDENYDLKVWIPDTNFDNPRNWQNGRLPCANDRVVLHGELISFVTSSISVSEIILPMDGQLVFGDNVSISLTGGTAPEECSREDAHFKATLDNWFDSRNWNISSPRAYPNRPVGSVKNPAVPHTHQVPCRTDHVVFRPGTTFKVHVETSTTVASISINDVKFDHQDLQNLLMTQTGNLLFPDHPQISVTGSGCNDETGCLCGNDRPEVMSMICSHHPNCPPIECSDPVQPIGHCCQICGAYLVMEYERGFQLRRLLPLHDSYLKKAEYQSVFSYTGKTSEGHFQTVFLDGGEEKGSASSVAAYLYDILSQDIKGAHWYDIRSIQMHRSMNWGKGVPTHEPYGTEQGISSGGVVGIIIAIALVCGCTAVLLYIYKKRQISGFQFARFDLYSKRVELELGTTPHEDLQPGESVAAGPPSHQISEKAFDNPVFGTETGAKAKFEVESAIEDPTYLENPMFSVLDEAEKISALKDSSTVD